MTTYLQVEISLIELIMTVGSEHINLTCRLGKNEVKEKAKRKKKKRNELKDLGQVDGFIFELN